MFRFVQSLWVLCFVFACADEKPAPVDPATQPVPPVAVVEEPVAPKPPPGPPKRLFTHKFVVNVRTAPQRDAFRVGYLRAGSVFTATTAEPVGHDKCRGGWYEMAGSGAFACSGYDVIAFEGKRLPERRAKQPNLESLLPYAYGFTMRNNTPVYRRLPTDEEAAIYEGYKIPGAPPPQPDGGVNGDGETVAAELQVAPQAAGAPGSGSDAVEAAAEAEEEGPPTLESLRGEQGGVLERRLVKGFYVSLDRDMRKGARRYWRTQANGFIPYHSVREIRENDFHGVELSREPVVEAMPDAGAKPSLDVGLRLPIGFVLSSKSFAYPLNKQGKPRRGKAPGYHFMFPIVGHAQVGGVDYEVAADGTHYRTEDVTRIDAREPPPQVVDGEKWIDVDLANQALVAYEGSVPVYATLISSGRVKDQADPLQNFATPTGDFRILSKHLTHTMDGDHAVDGPYSLEDVPYVMYFQLAYAIHSAFWHNSFGRPKSHGCINASPFDAKWLFNWVTPALPEGWHAVYPTEQAPSTRLYVRGEAPIL